MVMRSMTICERSDTNSYTLHTYHIKTYKKAIILGGGTSTFDHKEAIQKYTEEDNSVCLIHAGVRNFSNYLDVNCNQFYSLVGVESDKLLKQIIDPSKLKVNDHA